MSEAEEAQRNVIRSMPAMHSEVGQALSLLTDTVVALVAVTERQANAMERLADRLEGAMPSNDTGTGSHFLATDVGLYGVEAR